MSETEVSRRVWGWQVTQRGWCQDPGNSCAPLGPAKLSACWKSLRAVPQWTHQGQGAQVTQNQNPGDSNSFVQVEKGEGAQGTREEITEVIQVSDDSGLDRVVAAGWRNVLGLKTNFKNVKGQGIALEREVRERKGASKTRCRDLA